MKNFKLWLEAPSWFPEIYSSHISNLDMSRHEIDELKKGNTLTDQSGQNWVSKGIGLPEKGQYFISTGHPNEHWKPGEVRILKAEDGIIPTYRGYRDILEKAGPLLAGKQSSWGV